MKVVLKFVLAIMLISTISCGKKTTNESSGDKNSDTKTVTGKVDTVEYKCPGMHCSGCEESITEQVKKVEGVKEIKADAKEKTVKVTFDDGKTNKEVISKSINAAGYDTELTKSENPHDCDTDMKKKEKKN